MPIDPISLATVFGPMLYELAKREHQCVRCGSWQLNMRYVTKCCQQPICDGCARRGHLIRRGGRKVCPVPSCGNEYD